MCSQCSSAGVKTKITNETCSACYDCPEYKKAKNGDEQISCITQKAIFDEHNYTLLTNMLQYNNPDTYDNCQQSGSTIYSTYTNFIVPETSQEMPTETQNNHVDNQCDNVKETEIFNNHFKQQSNEMIQDMTQKIETCKNIKKIAKNFMNLTEEMKRPLYNSFATTQNKTIEKNTKIKNYLKVKKLYTCNRFMGKYALKTFDIADYIPDSITKYAYNKEIFDKQTEAIRTIFASGVIDFEKLFDILNEDIVYDNNDKKTLAKRVDIQMKDFLQKNINSLTLLFPKMLFFMEYYNKYQDDLVFFIDTKHVCMVYGMMHVLGTILKFTEHIVNEIKKINSNIIEYSNNKQVYMHNGINSQLSYFLATKMEIEKMLLYILTPFLPTDHFIDLANLFHIEAECSLGIYIFGTKDDMHLCKINKLMDRCCD
ncbi:hypothetical protein BDAP_002650 [Binucleata daphniae]